MVPATARKLRATLAELFGTLFEALGFCGILAATVFIEHIIFKTLGIGAGALLLISGHVLRTYAKRLKQPDSAQLLAADHRPAILYLRSFASDGHNAGVDPTQILTGLGLVGGLIGAAGRLLPTAEDARSFAYETDEEFLALALIPLGPVVAVGKPGEPLPPIGAARLYIEPGRWQTQVRELSHAARAVVVRAGSTPGLIWEIEHCLAHLDLPRLAFWLSWPAAGAPAQYAALCHTLAPHLQAPLPPWRPGAAVLCFDAAGRPFLTGRAHRFWEPHSSEWSRSRLEMAFLEARRLGALPDRAPQPPA